MLKARIVTALVLALLFGLDLFFAPYHLFALTLACVVAVAAWEWSRLAGVANDTAQRFYSGSIGFITLLCLYVPPSPDFIRTLLLVGVLFWVAVPFAFRRRPLRRTVTGPEPLLLCAGVVVFGVAALAFQYLRSHAEFASPWLLLYALTTIWLMDIGAYFSGRRFGRRKLAPLISPGKTWEGVWGGLAVTVTMMVATLALSPWPSDIALRVLLATLAAACASVLGDLFESRMKRGAGVKDSSQLLPGHGGMLDRIDGVLAAVPVFALVWSWA